ncbi:MAG: hypothetical protein GXP48_12670 [Acidobacteria bacterium]|nr:hypothetical protein [Acidobacteriota bacterium]
MNDRARDELARLREAFSAEPWGAAGTDCPEVGELWASATGELDHQADRMVLLHLAQCSQCASIWRLAREMVLPGREEATPVVSITPKKAVPLMRRPSFLAAAATLVIGLGLGAGLLLHRESSAPPVYRQQRSAQTILAAPATMQLPRASCRLRWSAGPEGTRYDLLVTDENVTILATVKGLTSPDYLLPSEKIPRRVRKILWRVTAHLPDQRTVVSDTFTTRITD